MEENISNKMAKGAAWMVAFKLVERSIGLVSTIILARLLEPGDFGLVAMANAFLGMLMLLTSFSFDVALIQKQNAGRHIYDTAWTFNVIFGIVLALGLIATALPLSEFYKEGRLENILYILAFSTFLGGFSNIGPVSFRKDLQFHKEFYFQLAKKLIGFTVCITLAFTLRNYWALVWGTFAGRVLEVLLSYRVHPYRPRFCLSGRKELFGFSMWMFANNSIYFAYHRLADFIVSKIAGSHALGIYGIAYEIANLPTTELVAPINRAVLPGYAKMAHDRAALQQGFLNVLSLIALFAIPAGIGIALIADPLVSVVLGTKWRPAIPLVEILALSGTVTALQTNASVVYNALGKPKYMTAISFFHLAILFLPMLVFFINKDGILGVAQTYLYSNLLIWPINYAISMRLVRLRFLKMASVLWRPLVASALMYWGSITIILKLQAYGIIARNNEIILLFAYIAVAVFIYCAVVLGLWFIGRRPKGAEHLILQKLKLIKN